MPLVRLTYTSMAVRDFRTADLASIVASSQRNNRRTGITGFLTYNNGEFIQALEGKRETVQAVYDRIRADPRHSGLRLLAVREIDTREFASWDMQLIRLEEDELAAVREVLERPRLASAAWADTAVEERLTQLVRAFRASCHAGPVAARA